MFNMIIVDNIRLKPFAFCWPTRWSTQKTSFFSEETTNVKYLTGTFNSFAFFACDNVLERRRLSSLVNENCFYFYRVYGFYDECKRKYSTRLWKRFVDVFNCLPAGNSISDRRNGIWGKKQIPKYFALYILHIYLKFYFISSCYNWRCNILYSWRTLTRFIQPGIGKLM